MAAPDGRIGHAEIEIEGGLIMLRTRIPRWAFARRRRSAVHP